MTVRAMLAGRGRRARLARRLGLDANPLRRASDRAEAWVRLAVLAAFLAGAPLVATMAADWVHHAATTESVTEAGQRHAVRAVVQSSPVLPPRTFGIDQAWVRAQWETPGGDPRSGVIVASPGTRAGTVVTLWLDSAGKPTGAPLQPGQVTARTIAAGVLAPAILALALLTVQSAARRRRDRRRLAAWDAAWSMQEPLWTKRRP
jgi:hypothetical protein